MNLLLNMRSCAIKNKYDCSFTPDLLAAKALLLLNRFAKNSYYTQRELIYRHKQAMILDWCERGHVQTCYEVWQNLPCRACDGTGIWRSYYSDYEDTCDRCGGYGVYKRIPIVQITLAIHGSPFVWHQPYVELYEPFFTDSEVLGYYKDRASHHRHISQWDVEEAHLLLIYHLQRRELPHEDPFPRLPFKRVMQKQYAKLLWTIQDSKDWIAEKWKPTPEDDVEFEDSLF